MFDIAGAAAGSDIAAIVVTPRHYLEQAEAGLSDAQMRHRLDGGVQINDWSPPAPGEAYVPMSGRLMPGDGQLPLAEILAQVEANSPGL